MGIDRFEDSDEGPSHEAKADLSKDTGSPENAHRSWEASQSGDVGRAEEPAPDNPTTRESSERAEAEVRPAESRTRSEYADHIAPPTEDDPSSPSAEDPGRREDEYSAAMPSGQGHTEEPHSAEEPDEQRPEEHWDEEQPHAGNDSTASKEAQHSPDDPAIEPSQPDSESTPPNDEPEKASNEVEADSDLNVGTETDDDLGTNSADVHEPSVTDLDNLLPDTLSTQEADQGTDVEPELTPSPEVDDESPAEVPPAAEDPDQDTSEIDDRTRPLTDHEWVEHLTEVRDGLDWARRHRLQTHRLYTIDSDKREWSAPRNRLQSELVSEMYSQAQEVPCEQRAIIAGGLGGAGKTTVLTEHANIDLSKYLVVNPDDIKEEMAQRGMIPEVSGLSPMEASDLAHEESSYIAKRLAMRAMADGRNLIWDITMSAEDSTKERINNLRSAGYDHIEGIFVDIPVETSVRRIDVRHREGHERYRTGHGLGGRFVPEEVVRSQEDPEWGSQNRRTYERVKNSLDTWSVYDNSVDGRAAKCVESSPK